MDMLCSIFFTELCLTYGSFQVRYWVNVKVDRPWAFDDKQKLFFTVISVVNLNDIPHAKVASARLPTPFPLD